MLFSEESDLTHQEFSYEKLLLEARAKAAAPVKDIMIPIKTAINYNDHIIKLMYEMVETNTSFLPVLKEGRVVGVVRSVDIFHEIARIALED
jgi:CBS-domain-containing membrane protein